MFTSTLMASRITSFSSLEGAASPANQSPHISENLSDTSSAGRLVFAGAFS